MKTLITSALPYVNNVPHLGNLIGSTLSSDVFARYKRSRKEDVLFVCGSDEHGTTTETKALEENLTPKELCDKYYKIHKEIYEWFNISFDIFGRTSDETQTQITQEIFLDLHKNGFIKEDTLKQLYCGKDKRYLADRFVEGTCPHCGFEDARGDQCDNCSKLLNPLDLIEPRCKLCSQKPIVKEEKHLFLDLKTLQPQLEDWFEKQIQEGKWTQNAISITRAWLKEGLEQRCITRDLKWGVKVPLEGWEDKVFYVWFDAPIGYISITKQLLKDKYKDWWLKPDEIKLYQFMGKDNVPFHSIIFPASLIGSKQPWVKVHHISATEYLQYEDGKFSKSRGTGIFGHQAKQTNIPADVFRYYLLQNRPETSDTKFSWKEFQEKLNNELVATLGNLVNRTLVFVQRYCDYKIEQDLEFTQDDLKFWEEVKQKEQEVTDLLDNVKLKDALKKIMEIARLGNIHYQNCAPWKQIKENPQVAKANLSILTHLAKDLAILIGPYMPTTAQSIFDQLGIQKRTWNNLGVLDLNGHTIKEPKHLFQKVEDKQIKELKEKFSGKKETKDDTTDKQNIKPALCVAKITEVTKHPTADKLYIEQLDLGPLGKRQIISGLVGYYTKEELLGKHIIVVANLKEAKLRGELSQGMLLAAEDKKDNVGIVTAQDASPGDFIQGFENTDEQIDIKQFFNYKFKANGGLYLHDEELKINGKSLQIDKDVVGKVK